MCILTLLAQITKKNGLLDLSEYHVLFILGIIVKVNLSEK